MPFIPPGIRTLLDVGCSDGHFAELAQASRPGLTVDGVEPDPATAERASRRVNRVYAGFFPHAIAPDARYDCITFLDCLEHIVEPWDALRAASHHLSPGGRVVASLPNIRHISALTTLIRQKDWPWDDQGIFDRTHVRSFTKTSMARLFTESGFTVEAMHPINEWNNPKTRLLAPILGADIKATQFVVVASTSS